MPNKCPDFPWPEIMKSAYLIHIPLLPNQVKIKVNISPVI